MSLSKGSFGIAFIALLLFVGVEAWLAFAHPFARLPVNTIEQGEAFNAFNVIERETQTGDAEPYVVLLGSSLMVAPVVQAESAFRSEPLKRFFERRATACEKSLSQELKLDGSRQVKVFNAAIGGGMASDDYFVVRKFLAEKNRPIAIVCGVAPRDFQDNLVPELYSTNTFQVFANAHDLGHIFNDEHLTQDKKFDVAIGRFSILWRDKAEVKQYLGMLSKRVIEKVCPFIVFEKYGATGVLGPQKKGRFPEEIKGTPMAYPGLAIDHYDSPKTINQYLRSYNPVNKRMYDEQFKYFEQLLQLSKREGVQLLIANMPLSQTNKSLMPKGFYGEYLNRLKSVCAANEVAFADYNDVAWDNNENFIDTVHLRPEMSASFVSALMKSVADSPLALAFSSGKVQQLGASKVSRPQ